MTIVICHQFNWNLFAESNWQSFAIIGSSNGLSPTITNDDPVQWNINTPPSLNELTGYCFCADLDISSEQFLDSKVHGANMGPTWVLSAPDGPHVGPMNLAIRVVTQLWVPRQVGCDSVPILWHSVTANLAMLSNAYWHAVKAKMAWYLKRSRVISNRSRWSTCSVRLYYTLPLRWWEIALSYRVSQSNA